MTGAFRLSWGGWIGVERPVAPWGASRARAVNALVKLRPWLGWLVS